MMTSLLEMSSSFKKNFGKIVRRFGRLKDRQTLFNPFLFGGGQGKFFSVLFAEFTRGLLRNYNRMWFSFDHYPGFN